MGKLHYQRKTSLLHIQGSTAAAAPTLPPVTNPSGFCEKPQGCRETTWWGTAGRAFPAAFPSRAEDEQGRLRALQRSEANRLPLPSQSHQTNRPAAVTARSPQPAALSPHPAPAPSHPAHAQPPGRLRAEERGGRRCFWRDCGREAAAVSP